MSISRPSTCPVLPSSGYIHQTKSSGLAPTSHPSCGASSIPRWDATMQVHECKEWQYKMPHIKVFKMNTRLHRTYISTPRYLVKHSTTYLARRARKVAPNMTQISQGFRYINLTPSKAIATLSNAQSKARWSKQFFVQTPILDSSTTVTCFNHT